MDGTPGYDSAVPAVPTLCALSEPLTLHFAQGMVAVPSGSMPAQMMQTSMPAMSHADATQLAAQYAAAQQQFQQLTPEQQQQLIELLDRGESLEVVASSVTKAHPPYESQRFGPTIESHLVGLALSDQGHLDFISSCPPSPTELRSFFQGMERKTRCNRQKLRFGKSFWVFVEDPC